MRRLVAMIVIGVVGASACTGQSYDSVDRGREADVLDVVTSGWGSVRPRPEGVALDGSSDLADHVFVEITARRVDDGAIEVGVQLNATTLLLPRERVFDLASVPVGRWWSSSSVGSGDVAALSSSVEDGGDQASAPGWLEVEVRARRLDGGDTEFVLAAPSGRDLLPRERVVTPSDLLDGRWFATSPLVLSIDGERAGLASPGDAIGEGFGAISLGSGYGGARSHACGIGPERRISCWGEDRWGQASPPDGEFVAVSAGGSHTCALRTDGDAACWGDARRSARVGVLVAVSAADSNTCGIRPDGSVECWSQGRDQAGAATPPAGAFVSVSAGSRHSCGLRISGEVACWGTNSVRRSGGPDSVQEVLSEDGSGPAAPPAGAFTAVTVGYQHSCGIRPDGTAECWGDDYYGQSSPPDGTFTALSADYDFTCGLRTDGSAVCWGGLPPEERFGPQPEHLEQAPASPPAGSFTALSVGDGEACGLRPDGRVDCWFPGSYEPYGPVHFHFIADHYADGDFSQTFDVTHVPAGSLRAVSVGGRHACGIDADAAVNCWGGNVQGQATPPPGRFHAVSSGGRHTCAIAADRLVTCWGETRHGQAATPSGTFSTIDAGWEHTCGVHTNERLACWGDDTHGQSTPPSGVFRHVAAGGRHSCGLHADWTVTCWGDDTYGQADAPSGDFRSVVAGALHTCGLRFDRAAECWGADDAGQSSPPERLRFDEIATGADYSCGRSVRSVVCWGAARPADGPSSATWSISPTLPNRSLRFTSLSAGSQIACGILVDTTAECWIATRRRNIDTPPSPTTTRAPAGEFTTVSAGAYHNCALDTGGVIACWGENTHAQATPPTGLFEAVSSGERHSCAIAAGGEITCWGENTFGQARPPSGRFDSLSAGAYFNCALDSDGAITCWGDEKYRQATPPSGEFASLSAGERHACALDPHGAIACWGDNALGQATPPAGTYTALDSGKVHTCALSTGGAVICWGRDTDLDIYDPFTGRAPPATPRWKFTAIAVGTHHTCAIDMDGNVECAPDRAPEGPYDLAAVAYEFYWRAWSDSRSEPLPGPFATLSAGMYHTCGIRFDDTIDCWSGREPRN